MSETPRTDQYAFQASWMERAVVDANFARTLERELTAALVRAEKAEADLAQTKLRHDVACDTITSMQHQRARAWSGLTFDAFRLANKSRCLKWHPDGIESWSPSDWLTAVTGELGELASLLKMRNRERDGLPGNKFSPTQKQIADELADVVTYLDLLAEVLGVDLGRAAAEKFNEVSERVGFPDRIVLDQSSTTLAAQSARLERLEAALRSVSVDAPDADGLVWLRIKPQSATGSAAFNLGKADRITAQVGLLFEEDRIAALQPDGERKG